MWTIIAIVVGAYWIGATIYVYGYFFDLFQVSEPKTWFGKYVLPAIASAALGPYICLMYTYDRIRGQV